MGKERVQIKKRQYIRDIVLLFGIPLAVVLLATIISYIPRLLAHPSYDFIYTKCGDYACQTDYLVGADQRIIKESRLRPDRGYIAGTVSLYYYNAQEDSSRRITLNEAKTYRLSGSSVSPDGYSLKSSQSNNGFLFWGDDKQAWYLINGMKKKAVDFDIANNYSDEIEFVGWVK